MTLLDTDHLTALKYPESERYQQLSARIRRHPEELFVAPVVSIEEQLRGWMALLARGREPAQQVGAYQKLAETVEFFAGWIIVGFDDAAAAQFARLRRLGVCIGSMDLKIASIALVQNATLLTANTADFSAVPGLRFENWLDPVPEG